MAELERPADVNLDKYGSEEPQLQMFRQEMPDLGTLEPETPPNRRPVLLLVVLVVLGLILVAGTIYLRRSQSSSSATTAQKAASAPAAVKPETGGQVPVPPLEQTDPLVRQLV